MAKLGLGLIPLLAFLMSGCSKSAPGQAEASAKAQAAPLAVRVATAETRQLGRTLAVTGSLQPDETVSVSAEVAGRVSEIHVDFGQSVRQGEIIAELDKREFVLQCDRSRAALSQALARIGLDASQEDVSPDSTPSVRLAKAQMEDMRFKYENAARLIKTGDVSQERYVEMEKALRAREAAYEAARDDLRTQIAGVQALRAELKLAQKRLSDATVRAPFDGSVTARLVSPGQYLRENTPILTLVKAYPLRLRADIPESAAGEIRVGGLLEFSTDAAPGARFHAVVREMNPALEARSRSLTVEARIRERDPRLRPGMFVRIDLALARDATAVVVPSDALYQIAGLTKVFVIRDRRVIANQIAPGREISGWVEVPADRVRPGDSVAIGNLGILVDGAQVVVVEAGR
jgi:RND family efflux transporter MFP subunit